MVDDHVAHNNSKCCARLVSTSISRAGVVTNGEGNDIQLYDIQESQMSKFHGIRLCAVNDVETQTHNVN